MGLLGSWILKGFGSSRALVPLGPLEYWVLVSGMLRKTEKLT